MGDDLVETDESTWYQPTDWFGGTPWDTGIELGLNGSTGNNESFSIRTGGYVKRESRFSKLDYSIYYNRTTTGEETTQNNATTDIRNDWLLDDSSPWSLFAKANVFYDQFQAFDLQTNGNSGIGYQIFKDPAVNLTTRVGGGASREFGGPDNEWVPEALFGFEYEQSVTDTQKFFAKLEYYPAVRKLRPVPSGGRRRLGDRARQAVEREPQDLGQRPLRQHAQRRRAALGELLGAAAPEALTARLAVSERARLGGARPEPCLR